MFRESAKPEVLWLPRGFEFLSGLPEPKRKRKRLLVFQAFIDDSGTKGTGRTLFLGGLFGSAEAFASLSDRWDMELRARIPLSIGYFKAEEARNLDGEFRHWRYSRRDEKVRRLAAVLDRDDITMVYSSVALQPHSTMEYYIGKSVVDARRHPYNQPYLLALATIVLNVALEVRQRGGDQRVEIILDEHVIFQRDAAKVFEQLCEVAPDWLKRLLPNQLYFRDDREFIPLQAADLLMGHFRMTAERQTRWPKLDLGKLTVSPFRKMYGAEDLSKLTAMVISRSTGIPEGIIRDRFRRDIILPESMGDD